MVLATSPAGLEAGLLVLSMSFACLLFVCWLVWLVGWVCGGVVVCVCFLVRPSFVVVCSSCRCLYLGFYDLAERLLGWWAVTPGGGGGGVGGCGGGCGGCGGRGRGRFGW